MMMILSESDRKSYAVECLECWHYSNRKFLTEEQAIKYWNDGSQDGYDLVRPPEVEE